jgi:hypothetical protein
MAPTSTAPMEMIRRSFESWYYWFPTLVYGFLGALSMYNIAWENMDKIADRFKASYYDTQDTFDFIVGEESFETNYLIITVPLSV